MLAVLLVSEMVLQSGNNFVNIILQATLIQILANFECGWGAKEVRAGYIELKLTKANTD